MVPTLFGITLITFFIIKLAPGDPNELKLMFAGDSLPADKIAAYLADSKPALDVPEWYVEFTESASQKLNSNLGDPEDIKETSSYKALMWIGENTVFYGKWISKTVRLDFGRSLKDHQPVADKIWKALPVTLLINIISLLIIYSISMPLGIWSALNKNSAIDKVVMIKLFVLYSLPSFWVASMLLMFFAGADYFDVFPIMGVSSSYYNELGFFEKIADVSWHLVLPVIASTIGGFAFLTRFSRSNFLDVVSQDYVRTARAKGLSEFKVLYVHALKNALIPFVTLMGTLLPSLLGGSVVIEQIFSIPGMGLLSFDAVLSRDHNTIMAVATIGAFLTLVGILLSDLMYGLVDPRIRLDNK